jgi:hypothetical protein
MSLSAVLLDGARRAAAYATLLFSLDAPPPAAAQSPPSEPAAAALAVDGSVAESGLTLVAHHLDVRIAGSTALVQALMLLRNDRPTEVAVQYVQPQPARVVRGDAAGLAGPGDVAVLCDEGDLSPQVAQQAETAPGRLVRRYDVIVLAPGEQISLELQREMPVEAVGGVHRLQLPLPVDRQAPWVPRFTADVRVEAGQPIRRLSSPTHQALVDGLGENTALMSVPDGYVYRQTQLAVEFELDRPDAGQPMTRLPLAEPVARRDKGSEG